MTHLPVPRTLGVIVLAIASLAGATVVVWLLESSSGIPNAGIVYVVAVAATAVFGGTPGAIGASIAAFLLYDFYFTEPRYTLTIRAPEEWLNVLLLMFVAILVGQLTATQRRQTEVAREREREARALYRVSRVLATRSSTLDACRAIVDHVVTDTIGTRAWIEIADPTGLDRVAVDTAPGRSRPATNLLHVLRRTEGDATAEWVHVHTGTGIPGRLAGGGGGPVALHKVRMEAGGRQVGALWIVVPRAGGEPGATDTRLFAAVADQVAQALEQDRLASEARAATIAREGDRVKTALLESVSHDLRTPLASIRAAAGTLMDRTVVMGSADRYAAAETIDGEADRLNRIVTNLLDLSRVEGGALTPELDGYDLRDLVETALDRARLRLGSRPIVVDLDDPPPVSVDPGFLDQILDNLFENVVRYTDPGVSISLSAGLSPAAGMVRLTVEDAGGGVPDNTLPRLFEKFYRVQRPGRRSKGGSGVGLAVVRGFVESMGGHVVARRSTLGGLAIDLDVALAAAGPVDAPPWSPG